jgi:BarA-like signal transduction histidine kinase
MTMFVGYSIQPLWSWHLLYIEPRVSPAAIHIEPLRGYIKPRSNTAKIFVQVLNQRQ